MSRLADYGSRRDQMLGVGIKGALWGSQALLTYMKTDRSAAIINMASPVAERGYPNTAPTVPKARSSR
jgi:NADP-dependent 3-hydroxy acid dehydrogenase YdfG